MHSRLGPELSGTNPERAGDHNQRATLHAIRVNGLVTRTVFPTIPPRVDYELTDLGRGLWQPVEALGKWAADHQAEIEDARARFDRRNEAG